jgi:hypothetical protein
LLNRILQPAFPCYVQGMFERPNVRGIDRFLEKSTCVNSENRPLYDPATLVDSTGIEYGFVVNLNFCTRVGYLYGFNHSYPSYTVYVKKQIYDFQQQHYSGWLGFNEGVVNGLKFSF